MIDLWSWSLFAIATLYYKSVCAYYICEHFLLPVFCTTTNPPWLHEAYKMLLFHFLNDFCQTNYLNIYWVNLHQICRVSRSMAADERSGFIFWSLKGRYHGNQFCGPSPGPIHTIEFVGHMQYLGVRQEVQLLKVTSKHAKICFKLVCITSYLYEVEQTWTCVGWL